MKLIVLIVLAIVVLVAWVIWIAAGGGDSPNRVFMRIMDIILIVSSLVLIVFGFLYKKEYEYKQSVPEEYREYTEYTEDELLEEVGKYDDAFDDENSISDPEEETNDNIIIIKRD